MAAERLASGFAHVHSSCRLSGVRRPARLSPRAHIFLSAVVVVVACSLAGAQGPESYAVPHLFGLPTATTARGFGMGGVSSCLPDIGFPNPAFAGMLSSARGGLRLSLTDFDGGMSLTGTQAWYAFPVGADQGMQVLGLWLDSDRGGVMTPLGPVPGEIEERDAAVHYGRRMSSTWLLGVGVAPLLETEVNLYSPVDGSVLMHTDSEAQLGARLGALYQFAPEGFAGLVFDWYTEDVNFVGPTAPGGARFDFTSTEWALGASARLDERVVAAVEWLDLESKDGALRSHVDGLHLGVEYAATPQIQVRLGSNDGQLSLGAGGRLEGWAFNYAFIKDWNDDAVGASFGGSDTHMFEAGRYW